MLDSTVRKFIDPPLDYLVRYQGLRQLNPNHVTVMGFLLGMAAIFLLASEHYLIGLFFICLNRLLDGMDGALARFKKISDFGGFLDIVCDFIIYAGVIFAFAVAQPEYAIYAAFLIFSYIGATSSFLAYAILAEKHKVRSDKRGIKSIYYLGGICEGTETAFVMIMLCIIPHSMPAICMVYGLLCWLTTMGRIYRAFQDFR